MLNSFRVKNLYRIQPILIIFACVLSAFFSKLLGMSSQSFFPLPLFFLTPIFIVLLFYKNKKKQIFFLTSFFGFLISLSFNWGIQSYGWITLLISSLLLSTQFIIWGLIFFYIKKIRLSGVPEVLFLSATFTMIERIYLLNTWFPVQQFAGAYSYFPSALGLLQYFSAGILTFFVFFTNLLFAQVLISIFRTKEIKKNFFRLLYIPLLAIIIFLPSFKSPYQFEVKNNFIIAALIQGGIKREEYLAGEDSKEIAQLIIDRYFNLTHDAINSGFNLIFWPETALWRYEQIQDELNTLLKNPDIHIIGGFPARENAMSPNYNAAFWLNRSWIPKGKYFKNILIPGHETNEFSAGTESRPLSTPFGNFSTPICFEILFPSYIRRMVKNGGDVILLLSNDAGFGKTSISSIILNQTILAAAEHHRYIIRVAQSGISALIHPSGKLLKKTNLFEQKILTVEFTKIKKNTFYTNNGPILLWIFLFLIYIFCFLLSFRNYSLVSLKMDKP